MARFGPDDHMERPYEALTAEEMATWDQAMRRAEEIREREPNDDDDQEEDDETE
jgi:hypothetical protein